MGWTTTDKPRHVKAEDYLSTDYYKPFKGEILLSVKRGSYVYQAIKMLYAEGAEPDSRYIGDETGYVSCMTYMTGRGDSDYNFGYKPQHELVGPQYHTCPPCILNLLSPFSEEYINSENNYAVEFRAKSIENQKLVKSGSKIKEGDTVHFDIDLNFTSGYTLEAKTPVKVIKLQRRRRSVFAFKAPNGGLYTFKGWKKAAKLSSI